MRTTQNLQEAPMEDLIRELRNRGCAIGVFYPEELVGCERERSNLENYMAEMGSEYLSDCVVGYMRLSVPGDACSNCGTIMTENLKCPGCGWNDPPTQRPKESVVCK